MAGKKGKGKEKKNLKFQRKPAGTHPSLPSASCEAKKGGYRGQAGPGAKYF
jgi:hypothetical protein